MAVWPSAVAEAEDLSASCTHLQHPATKGGFTTFGRGLPAAQLAGHQPCELAHEGAQAFPQDGNAASPAFHAPRCSLRGKACLLLFFTSAGWLLHGREGCERCPGGAEQLRYNAARGPVRAPGTLPLALGVSERTLPWGTAL